MANSEQFTPYKSPGMMKESPRSSQGNLTGHHRKLKDMAVDVHNTLQKWDSFNAQGHSIMNDIINVKLQFLFEEKEDKAEEGKEQKDGAALLETLSPWCAALQDIVQSMEGLVSKLTSLTSAVHGIRSLCQHRGEGDSILFSSWKIHHFVDSMEALQGMYSKELSVKKELCNHVAYADTRHTLMFYSAAWLHQPYVDSKALVLQLLTETGQAT